MTFDDFTAQVRGRFPGVPFTFSHLDNGLMIARLPSINPDLPREEGRPTLIRYNPALESICGLDGHWTFWPGGTWATEGPVGTFDELITIAKNEVTRYLDTCATYFLLPTSPPVSIPSESPATLDDFKAAVEVAFPGVEFRFIETDMFAAWHETPRGLPGHPRKIATIECGLPRAKHNKLYFDGWRISVVPCRAHLHRPTFQAAMADVKKHVLQTTIDAAMLGFLRPEPCTP